MDPEFGAYNQVSYAFDQSEQADYSAHLSPATSRDIEPQHATLMIHDIWQLCYLLQIYLRRVI
jgi:hypothetical protein